MPDTKTMLKRFCQMLQPNGQIFATTLVDNFLNPSFLRQFKEPKWAKYIPNEHVFANYTDNPKQYLTSLSNDVGLRLELCDYEKRMIIVEDFTDFLRVIIRMFPHFEKVPAELREDYFQDHLKYSQKPQLDSLGINVAEMWFRQDGATAHTANDSMAHARDLWVCFLGIT
ncbi:hypothetical protein Trydic_g4695 [Trypoxylus dichotomus]